MGWHLKGTGALPGDCFLIPVCGVHVETLFLNHILMYGSLTLQVLFKPAFTNSSA